MRELRAVVMYVLIITLLVIFLFLIPCFIYCEIFDSKLDLTEPLAKPLAKPYPIDVVYTWVNSKDPEWVKLKEQALGVVSDHSVIDNSKLRWVNTNEPYEEIQLSIESVRTHLPWVRNIFVVTQRPQKLPDHITSKFDLIHIHHDQIFKTPERSSGQLPVFSSHAIEANLHRIPGLSEHFIYFNDDMYINRPMERSDFFHADRPIFRYYKYYGFYINYLSRLFRLNEPFMNSNLNCRRLFEHKNLNFLPCIHHPTPITREIMFDAEKTFQKDWDRTANNKFRSFDDIVPVYISIAFAYCAKKAVMLKNDQIKHTLLATYIHAPLFHDKSHFICVNHIKADSMKLLRKQILSIK